MTRRLALLTATATLAAICAAFPANSADKRDVVDGQFGPIDLASVVAAGPPPKPSIAFDVVSQTVPYGNDSSSSSDVSASSKRGLYNLAKRDACDPLPQGAGPLATPDTDQAFLALNSLSSIASAAVTPSGYVNVFTNLQAENNAMGYLGYYLMNSYDVNGCASTCDSTNGCASINVAFERAPSIDPGQGCMDPPSTTLIKCVLWGGPVTVANAVNNGQWRGNFHVVVAGSNGYVNHDIGPDPGYGDPTYLGSSAVSMPQGCHGENTTVGNDYWNDGQPFDASRCSQACDATPDCKYFNTFIINRNGVPQGQYCSMFSKAATPSDATISSINYDGATYTISYSFAFANSNDPGRCLAPGSSYVGCYGDSPQRSFPVQKNGNGPMTLEMCSDLCSDYTYYGVEYASECYCGNALAGIPSSNNCNMGCQGNPEEACGGGWALDVYQNGGANSSSSTSTSTSLPTSTPIFSQSTSIVPPQHSVSTSTSSTDILPSSTPVAPPNHSTDSSSTPSLPTEIVSSTPLISSTLLISSTPPVSPSPSTTHHTTRRTTRHTRVTIPSSSDFLTSFSFPTGTISLPFPTSVQPSSPTGDGFLPCPTIQIELEKRQFYPPWCFPQPSGYSSPIFSYPNFTPTGPLPECTPFDFPSRNKRGFYEPYYGSGGGSSGGSGGSFGGSGGSSGGGSGGGSGGSFGGGSSGGSGGSPGGSPGGSGFSGIFSGLFPTPTGSGNSGNSGGGGGGGSFPGGYPNFPPFCTYPPTTVQSTPTSQPTGFFGGSGGSSVELGPSCTNPGGCFDYELCNEEEDCYCGYDTGDNPVCFQNEQCDYFLACYSNLECGAGWSCLAGSCCGFSLCAPTSVCAARYDYPPFGGSSGGSGGRSGGNSGGSGGYGDGSSGGGGGGGSSFFGGSGGGGGSSGGSGGGSGYRRSISKRAKSASLPVQRWTIDPPALDRGL